MKKFLLLGLLLTLNSLIYGQGVSINSTGATAHSSAMLDINSSNSGLLIPRMDSTTIAAIANPATSLLVYQTDKDSGFYFYDGTNWNPFLIDGAGTNSGWTTKGNSGTSAVTNFIGTIDSVDWVIRTNSAEQMRVKANGNVGIGTTTPNSKLHITNGTDLTLSNGTGYLLIGDESSVNVVLDNNEIAARNNGSESTLHLQTNGGDFNLHTQQAGGTQFVVKDDGNVGVGITTPVYELHVVGDIHADAGSFLGESANTNATPNFSFRGDENTGIYRAAADHIGFSTGGNNRMIIDDDGHVGIGTTSPNTPLQVTGGIDASLANGSGDFIIGLESTNNIVFDVNEINARNNGAESELNFQADGGDLLIHRNQSSGTQFMIKDDGKVGVGTIVPSQQLHLQSDTSVAILLEADSDNSGEGDHPQLRFSQDGGAVTGFIGYSGSTNHLRIANEWNNVNADIGIQTAGSTRMTINGGGNVGIGTVTPVAQLHTTGTVRFANFGAGTMQTDASGNVSVSSDKRLKKIVGTYNRGLTEVMGLMPKEYKWNKLSGLEMEGVYTGFIAQNVQEFIPEAIGIDNRGYLTLSDRPILAALVNAIKEQQQIIEEQNLTIQTLKTAHKRETDQLKVENTQVLNRLKKLEDLMGVKAEK